MLSPHHVAQQGYRPTGSESPPPSAPRSSRYGSEPPSVEDDVDVWGYAILLVAYRYQTQQRRIPLLTAYSLVSSAAPTAGDENKRGAY